LGRGLDALLPKQTETDTQPTRLPVDAVHPSSVQPRTVFDEAAVAELAQSIGTQGVLQPLLVRPSGDTFEIVAGERRYRAARQAGLAEIPVVVRELSDQEALQIAVVENLQRENLTPLEEARAYERLMAFGMDQAAVGEAVGKNRSTVANALRLLQLPSDAQQALEEGRIQAGHARAILAQPEADRAWALARILQGDLTVRQAEGLRRQDRPAQPRPAGDGRHVQLEEDLARHTQTMVRIRGGAKGRVELHFRSRDELERILELLNYQA
jgi:ParB family chromosome partitioning protein